jgi:hypothetical protein
VALSLARADTFTGVDYWMALRINELMEWVETIKAADEKRKK